MIELNPTSYVLLGTLSRGPCSGYGIKSILDRSARFFWASSYSQIYPELKRLASAGLIEGTEDPEDARGTVTYTLTDEGRSALRSWLKEPPITFELRDEGLLKLFFAAAGEREDAVQILETMRERRRELERELRELEPAAEALSGSDPFPKLVLDAGLEYARLFACWCEETIERLADENRSKGSDSA